MLIRLQLNSSACPGVSFFVACRSSYTPAVGRGRGGEGTCISTWADKCLSVSGLSLRQNKNFFFLLLPILKGIWDIDLKDNPKGFVAG